jgi:hypothetical protein
MYCRQYGLVLCCWLVLACRLLRAVAEGLVTYPSPLAWGCSYRNGWHSACYRKKAFAGGVSSTVCDHVGKSSVTDIEGRIELGRGGGSSEVTTEPVLRLDDACHSRRSGRSGRASSRGLVRARRSLRPRLSLASGEAELAPEVLVRVLSYYASRLPGGVRTLNDVGESLTRLLSYWKIHMQPDVR